MNRAFFRSYMMRSFIVGVVGILITVPIAIWKTVSFFQAYVPAYFFWVGITLGCLVWSLIYPLTGGNWMASLKNLFAAGYGTLGGMALLFLPILFGTGFLYPWADPERVAADPILQHKSGYLNFPFFCARQVFYFLCWILLAVTLNRSKNNAVRLSRLGAGGFVFYGFAMLFVSADWMVSLSPTWSSTMFSLIVMATQAFGAAAFAIFVMLFLCRRNVFEILPSQQMLRDFGNIFLTLILLWSYLVFMQFLIIWAGNLPKEVIWYLPRTRGFWGVMIVLLAFLQFALPFFLLLFRGIKAQAAKLEAIAGALFIFNFFFMNWLLVPFFPEVSWHVYWIEIILFITIGGLWMSIFSFHLLRDPPTFQHLPQQFISTNAEASHA